MSVVLEGLWEKVWSARVGQHIPPRLLSATPSTAKTPFSSLCSESWGNWWQTWSSMAPVLEKVFNGLHWHISYPFLEVTLLKAEEPAPSHGTSTECHLIELHGQLYLHPRLFLEVFHSQWTRPKSACLAGLLPKLLWLQIREQICIRELRAAGSIMMLPLAVS